MPLKHKPPYTKRHCSVCDIEMNISGASFECPKCFARSARSEFIVPTDAYEKLEQRFALFSRRASRLGIEGPTLKVIEQIDIPEVDRLGKETGAIARFVAVAISGASPKLPGYELIAVIRHLRADNAEDAHIVSAVGEHHVPEKYRHTGPVCEHCHVNRQRNDTFLVQHDDARIVQVGRSCLRDYLGHRSIERITALAELMVDALEALDEYEGDWDLDFDFFGGEHKARDWSLVTYLAYVSSVIEHYGWCSRANAQAHGDVESTSEIAWTWMCENYVARRAYTGHHALDLKYPEPTTRDYDRANAARAWASALHDRGDELSDYEHNVNVVARVARVDRKTRGIGASILPVYDRHVAKEADRAKSQWFGNVKREGDKKYKRETYELSVIATITVGLNSRFGSSILHIMRDANGNKAVWTTRATALSVGATYRLKVTIEKHDEYKGEKQTVLTRCEVIEQMNQDAGAASTTEVSAAAA